jgi:hypothetical protein
MNHHKEMDIRRIYDEAYYHFCRAEETYEMAKRQHTDLYNNVRCIENSIQQEEVHLEYLAYHNRDTTETQNRLNTFQLEHSNAFNVLLAYVYPEYEQWNAAKATYEEARREYYA